MRRPLMYGQRHDDADRVSETECGRVPAVLVCVCGRPAMNHSLIIYARVGYERRGRGRGGQRWPAAAAARDGTQPADERLLGGRRADLLDSQLTTTFRVYANLPPRA